MPAITHFTPANPKKDIFTRAGHLGAVFAIYETPSNCRAISEAILGPQNSAVNCQKALKTPGIGNRKETLHQGMRIEGTASRDVHRRDCIKGCA